jgi:hypothetical protein
MSCRPFKVDEYGCWPDVDNAGIVCAEREISNSRATQDECDQNWSATLFDRQLFENPRRSNWQSIMRWWFLLLLTSAIAACGDEPAPEPEVTVEGEPGSTRRTLEQLPPMPGYPNSSDGYLVAVSDGDFVLDGRWRATAGLCADVRVVELYAEDTDGGTALVLHYPEGEPTGEFPIMLVDSATPDKRLALIGVQVFEERDAFGFQAFEGIVEIVSFDERLSGRFASTVRDIQTDILTRYVGVFAAIRVEDLGTDYCDTLRPVEDADTSQMEAVPDSGETHG